jgi:opacity protein-like surface antigen
MLKYRLKGGVVAPFFGAGVSIRNWSGYGNTLDLVTGGTAATSPVVTDSNNVGFVAGAGLRFNFFVIKLSPEVRYTRWSREQINSSYVHGTLYTKKDQIDILIGLTF